MKTDITMHSDQELSLLVFNDEYLYKNRRSRYFLDIINEMFIYTDEQLEELNKDLNE